MAGVALANMDWVEVAEIGLALKVEWGPVFAGESRAEAYRYGGESLRGQRRPTVNPVTSAAEVLIRGWRRACQDGLGRSRVNRFGLKGGVGAGVRREYREQACQRGAVCHKSGPIPSPTTDARPLAFGSRRRPDRDRKYFVKSKIISEYIYRLYLRHAITLKVVAKSFFKEKRRRQQLIFAVRWFEYERAERRPPGNPPQWLAL